MCVLKCFLESIQLFLTNDKDFKGSLIKLNTRKLCEVGDFSFSLHSIKGLQLSDCLLKKLASNDLDKEDFLNTLLLENWALKISQGTWINDHTFTASFDKTSTFCSVIKEVLDQADNYGRHKLFSQYKFSLELPFEKENIIEKGLSDLRMFVFYNALKNILMYSESDTEGDSGVKELVKIKFVYNKIQSDDDIKLLCGPVVSKQNSKKMSITSDEYHRKRGIDLRLMAEHKYGLRVTQNWQELFTKLSEAAVIIELLQNKISQATVVDIDDHTVSRSKGASFILYNCGRLSTLFRNYDKKVSENVYPSLTSSITDIEFALLNEPEEWQLLYVFVSQFPIIIENCIKDIFKGHANIHHVCSFLSNMCSIFSVYYSRVRILSEPRKHLFPLLFARLYLLKAVETVLHNGLKLLNIQPVKQM